MAGFLSNVHNLPSRREGLLDFSIGVSRRNGRVVVAPRGELDIATAPELERVLERAAGKAGERVRLDLGAITFIDVAGARAVCRCVEHAERRGVVFSVALGTARTRRVFELCGLLGCLPAVASA